MPTIQTFEAAKAEVAGKVRKLLTQAEDPAATPEEAHAFTMKAQELMTKYSIELAMVTDAAHCDGLVAQSWTVEAPYAGHKVGLIHAVARANDCRAIYSALAGGRKRIEVVGYEADVSWVEILSRSLEIQMAGALAAAHASKPGHVHGRTFAVGFIQGFITEVNQRLHDARRAAVAAAEALDTSRQQERDDARRHAMRAGQGLQPLDSDPEAGRDPTRSVALVLVAKAKRVDEEFKVRHPRTRTVHSQVRLQSWSGYAPGRAAGRRASLARGAVGTPRTSLGRTRDSLSA